MEGLKEQQQSLGTEPDLDAILKVASYLQALGEAAECVSLLERAMLSFPGAQELVPFARRMQRSLEAQQYRNGVLADLVEANEPPPEASAYYGDVITVHEVPVVREVDLSLEDFMRDYADASRPVIIKNCSLLRSGTPWSFESIKERLGSKVVTPKRFVAESTSWARLESADETTLATFVDRMMERSELMEQRFGSCTASDRSAVTYVHDWQLPAHGCDELLEEIVVPKYFCQDFLQRLPSGSLYRESWPSLFIGPKGSCTGCVAL